MKIIHLITGLETGGAEKALYNILNGGLASRLDNHVVSLMDRGTMGSMIEETGTTLSTLGMKRGMPSISSFSKLCKYIESYKPDLIQGWMYHGNLAASIVSRYTTARSIVMWNVRQTLYNLQKEKFLTRQVIRANKLLSDNIDTIIYNSQVSRKQHEHFGFKDRNGLVIPNGIDLKKYYSSFDKRIRTRNEIGIPPEVKVVGHIARFHPMKDHQTFLKSSIILAKLYPQLHFILIGKGVSYDNRIFKENISDDLYQRFHLLDERKDIPDLLNAMDILCLSSAWGEGFPNVIGEAMASCVPCVSTDVGDSSIIIGNTGEVVPPQNKEALVKGIERLLNLSKEEYRSLGVSAKDRIKSSYNLEVIVDQYAILYENAIMKKKVI